jgi:hypothetical protein
MKKLARCKMVIEGYVEYKRREFCKDVKCPVQHELNMQKEGCPAYEQTRQKCSTSCIYTTWQFHRWLIEKGYLIVRPLKERYEKVPFHCLEHNCSLFSQAKLLSLLLG